jgi:hypothetical protein
MSAQSAENVVQQAGAAMPPAMAEVKSQSADDLIKELNRLPLFMTTLDETDGEGGENVGLEALKALAYEGTKAEVAENFRQQGNDCARAKQWTDAKEFYDKALAALHGPKRAPDVEEGERVVEIEADAEVDEEVEKEKEKKIEEACYVNRALCNLEKSKLPVTTIFAISVVSLRSPFRFIRPRSTAPYSSNYIFSISFLSPILYFLLFYIFISTGPYVLLLWSIYHFYQQSLHLYPHASSPATLISWNPPLIIQPHAILILLKGPVSYLNCSPLLLSMIPCSFQSLYTPVVRFAFSSFNSKLQTPHLIPSHHHPPSPSPSPSTKPPPQKTTAPASPTAPPPSASTPPT